MKKYLLIIALGIFGLVSVASAQTQLFSRDLSVGMSGSDVVTLQSWLIDNEYDIPAIRSGAATKGYFGSQTKTAVMNYQLANGIPNTGYVGPLTRARLNGNTPVKSITVMSPNGGEILQRGTNHTIQWKATGQALTKKGEIILVQDFSCPTDGRPCAATTPTAPRQYTLATNIDLHNGSYIWPVAAFLSPPCPAGYVCTPIPFEDGQYKLMVREMGTENYDMSDRAFTVIQKSSVSYPQVISPNGGETWVSNSNQIIRWNTSNLASNTTLDLYLDQADIYCITTPCGSTYTLDKNIGVSTIYSWIVATDIANVRIPDGSYRVRVCPAGSTNNCDSSDQSFKIVSNTAVPDINVISPNGGQTYKIGSSMDISWKLDGVMKPEYEVLLRLTNGGFIIMKKVTDSPTVTWTIPQNIFVGDMGVSLQPGSYKVRADLYDGPACIALCPPGNYGKMIAYDESDNYITITAPATY